MTVMTLEEIYTAYYGKVMGYISARIRNHADAEDLCADVFEKVQRRLDDYDQSKAAIGTWIFTITRNTVIDYFRHSRPTEELDENLSVLDLSQRSNNCLRRAGFNTLGDLLRAISVTGDERSKEKLLRLRNLGRKSAEEILLTIMCYQFQILSDKEKVEYLQDVIKLNSEAA